MKTLLIRAEDKNRWERRAPIVPADLADVIKETGAKAFVEASDKRFFKEAEYVASGAVTCDTMEVGDVIFGVKEIPVEKILPKKTYVFFSHTIKGQKGNMGMLRKIMDSGSTLIDYEKITDCNDRRLIYFGPFAGDAGAIDILSLMGEYWSHKGIKTPFSDCLRAHQYDSVAAARKQLSTIGKRIGNEGLPTEISPLTIGILGYGNVSKGAQKIFNCLPAQYVAPEDISKLLQNGKGNNRTIYLTVFKEKDLVRRADGSPFDLQDYYNHPEHYESRFDRFLPYFTLLVNAVYWENRYPRFVTWQGLKKLFETTPSPKLCGIADISCDTNGSIECNTHSTDSSNPAYRIDPVKGTWSDGHKGDGIVVLAVDNLPCELPNDSSRFFSSQLKPFIPDLLKADYSTALETSGLPSELKKAVIVYNGRLTEEYTYLKEYL